MYYLALTLIGIVTGLLGGILGGGVEILIVPLLTFFGLTDFKIFKLINKGGSETVERGIIWPVGYQINR